MSERRSNVEFRINSQFRIWEYYHILKYFRLKWFPEDLFMIKCVIDSNHSKRVQEFCLSSSNAPTNVCSLNQCRLNDKPNNTLHILLLHKTYTWLVTVRAWLVWLFLVYAWQTVWLLQTQSRVKRWQRPWHRQPWDLSLVLCSFFRLVKTHSWSQLWSALSQQSALSGPVIFHQCLMDAKEGEEGY